MPQVATPTGRSPAGTPRRRVQQQSGTPRGGGLGRAASSRQMVQNTTRGFSSRRSKSIPPPSDRSRPTSAIKRRPSSTQSSSSRGSGQMKYFPSSAKDIDLSSHSSGTVNKRETRQQNSQSIRRENLSLRDESPARKSSAKSTISKTSSNRGSQLSPEKISAIRKAIEDVNKHLNDDKRKAKLMQACVEFDHFDDARHNAELHYGAANVLALALTITRDDDELRMICSALEMVFRASNKAVHMAFKKFGKTTTPWLLQVLKRADEGKMKHADVSIMNVTKLFYYWSRIPEARSSMLRFPGMIPMIIRMPAVSNQDSKAMRMKLTANLANSDENKIFFVDTKGLLDAVLKTAVVDSSEKAKEFASTTLMDLAACPDNQVAMASDSRLLATMVKLAVTETAHETREAAISGLQNLAFCQANRVRLVKFANGVVLDALRKTLSNDVNDKARRRAAGALTNMACDDTAEFMGNHKGLLETLAVVSTKDESADVQMRAVMALTKVASSINSTMPCYRNLMDALIVASLTHATNSVSQVLRVKARDPQNREAMARHPGVLDTLSDICRSSDYLLRDRENAMRAIMHLTNEDDNRIVMCQRNILDALMLGASFDGEKWRDFSESAVVALERLATEHGNRSFMARHPGMLAAIAKVTEKEQRWEDDGVETIHERLAKPLLMSLLLAL